MMLANITNLKESLNKIAQDVHGSDNELDTDVVHDYPYISDRQNSHRFAHAKWVSHSPTENEIEHPVKFEIDEYKAEIKRLHESEAGIKALSINYASLLKEKEAEVSRLNEENGSLKQNLSQLKFALDTSRHEVRVSTVSPKILGEKLVSKQQKLVTQSKNHSDLNGTQSKAEAKCKKMLSKEKELSDLLEEKSKSFAALQETHNSQMRGLMLELENEQKKSASLELQKRDNRGLCESLEEELKTLRRNMELMASGSSDTQEELNEKILEIESLRAEISGQKEKIPSVESLRRADSKLAQDNVDHQEESCTKMFPGKEHLELALQNLETELEDVRRQRDRTLHELDRLKHHLLEKESEESDKMDEDSKIIDKLRADNEFCRSQMIHLEKMLKDATSSQEQALTTKDDEMRKANGIINDLERKLLTCKNMMNAKDTELLNLQTALGQYYAEIEARERVERDLALTKEELAKSSKHLKDMYQQLEMSKREGEESMVKLTNAERTALDAKAREKKLEDDNAKLRHVLEQSMTRLNIMSVDSDFLVDRRIVIKLLVTYFQRNHNKEVLDLMVRMLGFSDEDKQRIGIAQQGTGKGVVRGVLSLPGRIVGGIRSGSSTDGQENMSSENQSFADLWVDFLLDETEKERRELLKGGTSARRTGDLNTSIATQPQSRFIFPSRSSVQSPHSSI